MTKDTPDSGANTGLPYDVAKMSNGELNAESLRLARVWHDMQARKAA